MQVQRSNLRYKITLSLALAGLSTAGGVLLYRAAPAQGQESPDAQVEVDLPPPDERGPVEEAPVDRVRAVPVPPEVLERVRIIEEEMRAREEEADRGQNDGAPDGPRREDNAAPGQPTPGQPAAPGRTLPGASQQQQQQQQPGASTPASREERRNQQDRRNRGEDRPTVRQFDPEPANAPDVAAAATSQPAATQPADEAASTQPGAVLQNGKGILLNFKNASTDAVLDELSAVAGFIVVKEVASLSGRVTLVSKQPVSPDEAVSLLNTVLKRDGYAAVRQGRVLKVMPLSNARKSAIPVRAGSDPARIEPTDELITQVIPIRNADANQLKEDLAPLINTDTADFSSNASSNSIILTDTAANIRRIVEIVSALDTQMASSVDVRVFQLKYASSANAARLVTEVFGTQQSSRDGRSSSGFPFGGFSGFSRDRDGDRDRSSRSRSSGDSRTKGTVTASSDDRTNTVVVTGPPDTLDVVTAVIEKLDSDPTDEQSVFVYNLRNANSAQLESVINSLFNGTAPASRTGGSSNSPLGRSSGSLRQSGSSSRGGGLGSSSGRSSNGRSSSFGGSSSLSGGFGSSGFGQSSFGQRSSSSGFGGFGGFGSQVSSNTARSASALGGEVTVVADIDTNSLLVMTSPKNFERVKQIIEDLDRPVPQVLIKVLIAEVSHDNSLDVGAEFSVLNLRANGNGTVGGTDFGVGAASGGLVVKLIESDVTATLRLLERNGKLDVLSRPYILGSDNQLATIEVGQKVPFPTNNRVTDEGTQSSSITYDTVGIILDVVPHINPDGVVIMDVQPTISALSGSNVQISEQFNAPIINNRSAQSRVAIENGRTIVIGGMMEDRVVQQIRKVPILGDLPGIGAAFRRLEKTKTKTELLIFLTPHVAVAPDVLPGMSEDETRGTKILQDAVEPGLYQYHREGLQRGSTNVTPRGGASATQPAPVDAVHETPAPSR